MVTISNPFTKHSATMANQSKNSATVYAEVKVGAGWTYNQIGITYNGLVDPVTNLAVYYNSLGLSTSWSNLAKT